MSARKKWSTTTIPAVPRQTHGSQPAAYRHIRVLADQFHADLLRRDITQVRVWVDEGAGRGWELFETVRLAEVPPQDEEAK